MSLSVGRQESHKDGIAETALDKLVLAQSAILIAIQLVKDGRDPLLWLVVALALLFAKQVVDGNYDLFHFFLVDRAVVVVVVPVNKANKLFAIR